MELLMSQVAVQIGPAAHGRQMSLADFENAERQEGYVYELHKGVVIVSDVPDARHLAQLDTLRDQLYIYRSTRRGFINRIAMGSECKILLPAINSERHPDLAIYKTAPESMEDLWANWIPEIVIEVVSPSSHQRDYVEKREEYFLFGIREYWIIDASVDQMLVLRRSGGRWVERTIPGDGVYRSSQLPDFELNLKGVFDAARAAM